MFDTFFIVALVCLVELVRLNVLTREMLFMDSLRFALINRGHTVDYNAMHRIYHRNFYSWKY